MEMQISAARFDMARQNVPMEKLSCLNGIKPSLILFVAPVLFLQSQVNMFAMRKVYRGMYPQSPRVPNQTYEMT